MNLEKGNEQRKPEQTRQGQVVTPPVDILENENELLILADLPGVSSDKIRLDVQPPEFKIEASYGNGNGGVSYVRTFRVEERIDTDHVSAEYKNGVLSVKLPKSSASKPRRIEVKAG